MIETTIAYIKFFHFIYSLIFIELFSNNISSREVWLQLSAVHTTISPFPIHPRLFCPHQWHPHTSHQLLPQESHQLLPQESHRSLLPMQLLPHPQFMDSTLSHQTPPTHHQTLRHRMASTQ